MIPCVGLALYAEWPTDHRFLEGITRRTVLDVFVCRGVVAEVPEVQRLTIDHGIDGRADRIRAGAKAEQGGFHVLFIHADADGDADRARRERVEPGRLAVLSELGPTGRAVVAVVPVKMTEAWALADLEALRTVLSTTRSREGLGLPPSPAHLEAESQPKLLLDRVVKAAHARPRRRRVEGGATYLDRLAEEVRLETLRKLRAFRGFEADVVTALAGLGYFGLER